MTLCKFRLNSDKYNISEELISSNWPYKFALISGIYQRIRKRRSKNTSNEHNLNMLTSYRKQYILNRMVSIHPDAQLSCQARNQHAATVQVF